MFRFGSVLPRAFFKSLIPKADIGLGYIYSIPYPYCFTISSIVFE